MINPIFKFTILIYSLFYCGLAVGQQDFIVQKIDNRTGLSNSCVNTIFQDSDNLLWVGTWDGLNVFNGTDVQVFNINKTKSSNSIANNVIFQILEDNKNFIWIGTLEGISRYNKKEGTFRHYFFKQNKITNSINVRCFLARDQAGTIYVASNSGLTLEKFDFDKQSFSPCCIDLRGEKIVSFLFDKSGHLFVLPEGGVIKIFREVSGEFKPLKSINQKSSLSSLFYLNSKVFFVSDHHSLYAIEDDLSLKKVAVFPHDVRYMSYWSGHYIVSWSTVGYNTYDQNFKTSGIWAGDKLSLADTRIGYIMPGNDTTLWIGTEGNGFTKIEQKNKRFGLVKFFKNAQVFTTPVRALCEVNGDIWVGSKGNGITIIKNLGTKSEAYNRLQSFHTSLDIFDNCIYAIHKKDNLVYIGSDSPGITLFNLSTNKLINWSEIKGTDDLPYFNSVHSIIDDTDGSLWIGSESSGLIHLKIEAKGNSLCISMFRQYPADDFNGGPGNNVIYSLVNGNNSRLWIACRYGGLSVFNKSTGKFKTFKANTYEGSLSNNDVLSLFMDSRNRLWVGTSYGLNWIYENKGNEAKPIFNKIDPEAGLPNNTAHAISEDSQGNLWVSTNSGLAKINPEDFSVIQFKESDGLQSNEFSDNAVYKNQNGKLFFGGIYGLNYFDPTTVLLQKGIANLLISDIQIAGKKLKKGSLVVVNPVNTKSVEHYILSPEENFFELRVKPIGYTSTEKSRFVYILEGSDKKNQSLEPSGKISYSNISPGDYTLKLKWSNGEGTWTNFVPLFKLTIKQHFWLTLPAFLVYLSVISLSIYFYIQFRKNKLQMEHELHIEYYLREKEEEVHQEQLNWFTNIAHELQTPLTIIVGSLDRYIYKSGAEKKPVHHKTFLLNAAREASRLQYLIHQLLEFRKAQSNKLKKNLSQINISAFAKNITNLFVPLLDSKQIDFNCVIESNIVGYTDKDKLEKIIFNLVSNGIKYTPQNHRIIFSVCQINGESFQIEIANSGCQLNKVEAEKFFEKFFNSGAPVSIERSIGIGLAFTRELVNVLDGKINVELNSGWISFKVSLPLETPIDDKNPAELSKDDQPSFLLQTINTGTPLNNSKTVAQSNKESLMRDLDGSEKRKVLIVEDEEQIRFLLNDILKDDFIVYEATNGKDALFLMKTITPDLVISDIMMPEMDGKQLCAVIKTTMDTCHIPVIILTVKSTIDEKIEGYEAGADAYISKPFSSQLLTIRVKRLLDYRDKLRSIFKQESFLDKIDDPNIKKEDHKFLKTIVTVIEENLALESLDAGFLEKKLGISKRDLYRKVKIYSGMTPGEFVKNVRLQHAAQFLQATDYTVSEIFYKTGFGNQSYFYREFKKKYGKSPKDFRSVHRLPA